MTRKIGQRYIWIDALCIIQDSASDWEVEASRMASVYQNSFLTLVAATAAASDEGFLKRAHLSASEEWKKPFRVVWPPLPSLPGQGQGTKQMGKEKQRQTILAARLAFTDLEHSHSRTRDKLQRIPNPWATRAWTFQEQLLSKRMLLFTGYELRWICSSSSSPADGSDGAGGSLCECTYLQQQEQKQQQREGMDPLARSIFPLPETTDEVYETWHDIVEEYTNRQLTYQTDRLPAVSGLARVVEDRLRNIEAAAGPESKGKKEEENKYLAGLWEGNLTMDLAWRARFVAPEQSNSSGGSGCTCPPGGAGTEYIAPTFSWASITNPVCCRLSQPGWTPRCVVLDANCEVVTDANPLGRVKSGFVKMRGHLLKSTLVDPYNGKGDLYYTQPAGWEEENRLKVYPDQLLEEFDASMPSQGASKQVQKMERSVRRVRYCESGKKCPPPQRAKTGADVYLFLLGHTPGSRINERVKLAVYFLVLGLSGDNPGKFERVGLAIGEVEERKLEELLRLSSGESVVTGV